MSSQEKALVAIARLLDDHGIPYMVIGGLANAVWGVPRATLDVDVTVWAPPGPPDEVLRIFDGPFRVLPADPPSFVQRTRVLPVESPDGVRVDVIFGLLPFEEQAIQRAVPRTVAGHDVLFCTPEDLVILKIISEREKDRADVRALVRCRRATLDRAYLDPRIAELTALLERPEIEADYRRWLAEDDAD